MRTLVGLAFLALAACNNADFDGGATCRAQGGDCYDPSLKAACVEQGPSGCAVDPPTVQDAFCCIRFVDGGGPGPH